MLSRRRTRKPRICTYGCGGWIKSGSVYLRHANRAGYKQPMVTLIECSQCATTGGRAGLLEGK